MAPKSSAELRQAWDDFFVARGHTVVPSASLIPTHPSAPMFTNSGMMPFVPIFLGEEQVPFSPPRAVSIQACVRAGGKHNDLDAIGRSLRHLSFFEMLGSFSFGEYFKEKAIPWAWEFVTETLELDGDRIWVTVHISDDEAEQIWREAVGFPGERIQRLDKDNFWEMGETGPCGPSSEIFWDFGPELGPEGGPANPAAEERYVEIWNLVFQQYLRGADGALRDLPSKNIDTGAGLERILALMGDAYPVLRENSGLVLPIIEREEGSFRRTLATGSQILDTRLEQLADGEALPGEVAFRLHDTYGFPFEVTQETAELRGVEVDVEGFEAAMADQRARARAAAKSGGVATGDDIDEQHRLLQEHGPSVFTGRQEYETEATIIGIVGDGLFLDRTPFYAESGGQVGDTGTITTETGVVDVLDTTYALPGLSRHTFKVREGAVEVGQRAVARIDGERRDAIRRNHTGTHVLHWALREVLGQHVKQQGSLVAPDRLRFDFSHFEPVTDDQLRQIEDVANREILGNAPVRHYETTMAEARERGAVMFFGDKYGDIVRVLEAGGPP